MALPGLRPSRLARWLWPLVLLPPLAACGGKLAPLGDGGADGGVPPDDAGPEAEAGVDASYPDGAVVVTRIVPSSGPNSGGTAVSVFGAGFATDGGTQITFAGFPAASVACSSDTECSCVTPFPGPATTAQVVDVQATIDGVLGDPGAETSATGIQDRFTYLPGPSCTATLTCEGPYYPYLVVVCTTSADFYIDPLSSSQMYVATGTTYSAQTESLGGLVAACNGTPAMGSCTSFSIYEALWTYCGAPDFCEICTKWRGGICNPGPPPTCTL